MSNDNLMTILGLNDDTTDALINQAALLYSDGQFEKMRKVLGGAVALSPRDPRPHTLIGSSFFIEGRDREAEAAYQRAYDCDASDPYTLVALGELKLRALELEAAVRVFEELFALPNIQEHPAAERGRELIHTYYQKLRGD